jgi:hypothetical protein
VTRLSSEAEVEGTVWWKTDTSNGEVRVDDDGMK